MQNLLMKRTSNDPVESITRSDGSELEMDGGRAAAKMNLLKELWVFKQVKVYYEC